MIITKDLQTLGCVDDKISQDFDDKSILYASIDIDHINKKTTLNTIIINYK